MRSDFEWGSGEYQVMTDGLVQTCQHWDDLPATFDELLTWKPAYPPGPRSPAEQAWVESWPQRFEEVLKHARRHPHR